VALQQQMPVFAWQSTLQEMGMQADSVNVQQPDFYNKINELLQKQPLDTWKVYLRAHTLDAYARALSAEFVNAAFQYSKTLTGQKQLKPRWERMVSNTDTRLGEALGQLYVKKYFSGRCEKRMLELVNNLQQAFATRIDKLDWMSDSTKAKAKDKLNSFIKK